MNTDRFLKIYQTYSLEKISALSKKGLEAQYAQCEQLVKLQKELASNASATNLILRNQIKELERQEKVRYYKKLIFNIKQIADKIDQAQSVNLQIFLSSLFLPPAIAYTNEALQNLEEIADKEYAYKVLERIEKTKSLNDLNNVQYQGTSWSKYLELKEVLDTSFYDKSIKLKERQINTLKRNESKNRERYKTKRELSSGCLGCSGLFSLFIIGMLIYSFMDNDPNASGGVLVAIIVMAITAVIYNWNKTIREKESALKNSIVSKEVDSMIEHIQEEIAGLVAQKEAVANEFKNVVNSMNKECHDWKEQMLEILQLLPHELVSEGSSSAPLDPMLLEVAEFCVHEDDVSISRIQRKFAIGVNRANRIVEQLEAVGIVGPYDGNQSRELLCDNVEELNVLLKNYNERIG